MICDHLGQDELHIKHVWSRVTEVDNAAGISSSSLQQTRMETKEISVENRGNNQPDECEVCCNVFDHRRRPRTLPCGHSFCSSCVSNLIREWYVSCPSCRDRHCAKCVTQFPVNYGMEALIQKLNVLQPNEKSELYALPWEGNQISTRQNKVRGTDKLRHLAREQIDLVQKLPSTYSEMDVILIKYKNQVIAHQNALREQLNKLEAMPQNQIGCTNELIRDTRAIADLLQERNVILSAMIQDGREKCREAASMSPLLSLDPSPEEMANAIEEADRYIDKKNEWIKSCHTVILDNEATNAAEKLLAKTQEALRVTASTDDSQHSDNSSSFTAENPLNKTDEIKSLLRTHLLFALQRKDGKDRFARITLEENRIYLHHLQDKSPPEGAHIIQFNDVYKLVDHSSTLAFLNFVWNESDLGRLHVRLHPDTARARQFALLCTGLLGPTYANTKLLAVGNKGLPSEYVRGGDYQYNNGTGGASLLPGLRRGGEYWRQQLPGSVMAPGSWGDACSAQFIIGTRNPGLAQRDDTIYGQVEDGLHVLNAAIKDTRIAEVKVVDCGIVISL